MKGINSPSAYCLIALATSGTLIANKDTYKGNLGVFGELF